MKPSQILSYLYLGARTDAKSKETLESLNIKYILNCTPPKTVDPETGCPNYFQKDKSYHYLRIPIFDNIGENIGAHLDSAFKFIEEGKHYGNVLVHCHKGVSRSASFVIGYLMRKNEFTFDEALSFVQSIRPIVQPNEAFLKQLSQYKPYGEGTRANYATTESSSVRLHEPSSFDVALPLELVDVVSESIVSPDIKFDSDSVKDPVDEIPSVNCEDGPCSKRAKLI